MLRCPSCGASNEEGRRFCGACSQPLPLPCPRCGFENAAGHRFCGGCGYRLETPAPQTKEARATTAPPLGLDQLARYMPADMPAKIRAQAQRLAGERRRVTVLYADMVGFTAMSKELDPEELAALVNDCFARVSQVIYGYEGYIDKYMGDALLALFGLPIAHEDAAERAVRAALDIKEALHKLCSSPEWARRPKVRMRIGLNSGPVFAGMVGSDLRLEYTVIGNTVNMAQRLQETAAEGQILASEATYRSTQGCIEARRLQPFELRRKALPIRAYEVLAAGPELTRLERTRRAGLSPFIGRQRELARLRDCLQQARQGRGQVVYIIGAAGTGKSRLLHELRAEVEGELALFSGAALSYEHSTPYRAFRQVVRALVGMEKGQEQCQWSAIEPLLRPIQLGQVAQAAVRFLICGETTPQLETLAPQAARQALEAAIVESVLRRASEGPVMLVLEDVHWADAASLRVIDALAHAIEREQVLVVCLGRPECLEGWQREHTFQQLSLGPLEPADREQLARPLLAGWELPEELGDTIIARAGGVVRFS